MQDIVHKIRGSSALRDYHEGFDYIHCRNDTQSRLLLRQEKKSTISLEVKENWAAWVRKPGTLAAKPYGNHTPM